MPTCTCILPQVTTRSFVYLLMHDYESVYLLMHDYESVYLLMHDYESVYLLMHDYEYFVGVYLCLILVN